MSAKQQHNNILLAILGFIAVVVIVALIGFFTIDQKPDEIQGEVEVSEYRVSSKVPGRILEIRVKEGDFVRVGDTLAILDAPEVRAKKTQAQSAEDAAAAMSQMAQRGARKRRSVVLVSNRCRPPISCGNRQRLPQRSRRKATTVYNGCSTKG